MPVLIGVDTSLSMYPFLCARSQSDLSTPNAKGLLGHLLSKFESSSGINTRDFVCLAYLSEEASVIVEFTKDYHQLFKILELNFQTRGTKLNFAKSLHQSLKHCRSSWSTVDSVQCFFLTHGNANFPRFNEPCDEDVNLLRISVEKFKISIVFVVFDHPNRANNISKVDQCLNEILTWNSAGGSVYHVNCVDDPIWKSTIDLVYEAHYKPGLACLQFGKLNADVNIFPALKRPINEKIVGDDEILKKTPKTLNIFGFAKFVDLANPIVISRHLIIARPKTSDASISVELGKTPNLCVLLHGCTKVSEMVALCRIENDWFGFISDYADGRRSNLILSSFQPGCTAIPWLEDFRKMPHLQYDPQGVVQPTVRHASISSESKPSYSSGCQSWIHNYGLHSDMQKIIRYLKKLPEKDALLYQELNRTVNYAMSLGCNEFIENFREGLINEKTSAAFTPCQVEHIDYIVKMLSTDALKPGEPIPPLLK